MNLLDSLRRRSDKRRMYTSLMQLDDHLLRDIGLTRADLRARVIRGVAPAVGGTGLV